MEEDRAILIDYPLFLERLRRDQGHAEGHPQAEGHPHAEGSKKLNELGF